MSRPDASAARPDSLRWGRWLHALVLVTGLVLALLAFVPRLIGSADHDHAGALSGAHGCAACVLAQSPAAPFEPAPELWEPPPHVADVRPTLVVASVLSRAWSVPFACGPPAVRASLKA